MSLWWTLLIQITIFAGHTRLSGQPVSETYLSRPLQSRIWKSLSLSSVCFLLTRMLRIEFRSSCLHSKPSIEWAISPPKASLFSWRDIFLDTFVSRVIESSSVDWCISRTLLSDAFQEWLKHEQAAQSSQAGDREGCGVFKHDCAYL